MFLNSLKRGPFTGHLADIRFKSKYSKPLHKVSNSNILQYKKNNFITNSKNIFEKIKSINRKHNRHSSHQFKNFHIIPAYEYHQDVSFPHEDNLGVSGGERISPDSSTNRQRSFVEIYKKNHSSTYHLKNLSQSISPEFIVNCCERDCVKCVFSSSYDKNADKLSCCGMDCEYCEFSH